MNLKTIATCLILLLYSVWLIGCSAAPTEKAAPQNGQYHKISASDAKTRMDKNPNIIILDVRTPEEYQEKHISKALLLPLQSLDQKAAKHLPDKSAEILVYCRSGNRSQQAVKKLTSMGYTAVSDFGGISDWPYETVTDKPK